MPAGRNEDGCRQNLQDGLNFLTTIDRSAAARVARSKNFEYRHETAGTKFGAIGQGGKSTRLYWII
jgi:hypothetical protein